MDKKIIYITTSPGQTKKLGFLLAQAAASRGNATAFVMALGGDLGAGKTRFVQGFAAGLGIKDAVASPTFSIMKRYGFKTKESAGAFYHIDCYRLRSGGDLAFLGLDGIFNDPANIAAIEWPELAAGLLPKNTLRLNFEVAGKNKRRISLKAA